MKEALFQSTESEPTGNCTVCAHHKGMMNPAKGVRVPGESGKCTRPEGPCKSVTEVQANAMATTVTPLSKKEEIRKEELEFIVIDNFKAFYDVGCALREIRDSRLYRETHPTFEAYCNQLFDVARRTAYQLIEASSVVENVRNCAQNPLLVPANEAQARALTTLSPEEQVEAWDAAVNTAPNGRITAAHVKKTVRRITGKKEDTGVNDTRRRVDKSDLISDEFKQAFQVFLDAVSNARAEKWQTTSRKQVVKHLASITKVLAHEDALEGYEIPEGDELPMTWSDRAKVRAAGFTLYRMDKNAKAIKMANEKGNWVYHEKFKTQAAMKRAFAEIMQDSMSIVG